MTLNRLKRDPLLTLRSQLRLLRSRWSTWGRGYKAESLSSQSGGPPKIRGWEMTWPSPESKQWEKYFSYGKLKSFLCWSDVGKIKNILEKLSCIYLEPISVWKGSQDEVVGDARCGSGESSRVGSELHVFGNPHRESVAVHIRLRAPHQKGPDRTSQQNLSGYLPAIRQKNRIIANVFNVFLCF